MSMKKKIDINERRVIGGPREHLELMNLAVLKHPKALEIYDEMRANVWSHTENSVVEDIDCYNGKGQNCLTDEEKIRFNKNLARLSNLDGIQMGNISLSIMPHVTSPEFVMSLTEQASQEAVHVRTYTKAIDTYCIDPDSIHSMYITDELLHQNNEFILKLSRIIRNEYSAENFLFAIVYNICLEWLYFNVGFLNFYSMGRKNKMRQFIKDIRLIHRDERIHGLLFVDMWENIRSEMPELFTKDLLAECGEIIRISTDHEKVWGRYLTDNNDGGLTPELSDQFIMWRGDECSQPLGLGLQYGAKNPVAWFDQYSTIGMRQNFFETRNDNYQTGTFSAAGTGSSLVDPSHYTQLLNNLSKK